MGKFVTPKVFLLGYPAVDRAGLLAYLAYTRQEDFLASFDEAVAAGLSPGEVLCSLYAKLCYRSLVANRNANVTRTRDVAGNIAAAHDGGHGSVFEHAMLNFVVTDCSRVFTHELVRHRIGTAFSQTSGRFCRLDQIDLVWDEILAGCEDLATGLVTQIEDTVYLMECRKGLRKPPTAGVDPDWEELKDPAYCLACRDVGDHGKCEQFRWVPDNTFDFETRKKVTSAIRRIAPNGQANEIGFSINIRALRQVIQTRTAAGAEREIRDVFGQVYELVRLRFPTIFHGARTKTVDGLVAVYGMKTQPYEIPAGDPKALEFFTADDLRAVAAARDSA